MPKLAVSRHTARILAMLLRCGMICREELEVVLEMIEKPASFRRPQGAGTRR